MITLFDYWRSSASYRVRIALGLAGLGWTSVPVDLINGGQTSLDHLARNPQGLVPVMEIDGAMLTQSLAIIEYLDESHGLGLLPATPLARAHTRAIAYAIAMDLHPLCNPRVATVAVAHSHTTLTINAWMQTFMAPALLAVEQMVSADGRYCCGDTVTIADLCLVPQLYNARRWEVDLAALPRLSAIDTALCKIPAFIAAHPERAPR